MKRHKDEYPAISRELINQANKYNARLADGRVDTHKAEPELEKYFKKCRGCGYWWPRNKTGYYKNPHTVDGLTSWCKECTKASSRQSYLKSLKYRKRASDREKRLQAFAQVAPDECRKLRTWGFRGRPPRHLSVIYEHFRNFYVEEPLTE